MPTLTLTKQEQFFYDSAGHSWDPKIETQEQGRVRCAKRMAEAETYAQEQGWYFDWMPEQESARSVFGPPCRKKNCKNPTCGLCHYDPDATFYACVLREDIEGPLLASLGMIEEPSREYRRVVEAELALEAMPAS